VIKVTDVAGKEKYINASLLEGIELIPDTRLVFVNGHSMIVRESPETIVERIVDFRHQWVTNARSLSGLFPVLRHDDVPQDETPGCRPEDGGKA